MLTFTDNGSTFSIDVSTDRNFSTLYQSTPIRDFFETTLFIEASLVGYSVT